MKAAQWWLTSDPKWSYGVLIEREALLQSVSSHVFIEDITPSEIENATEVLVLGDQPWGSGKTTVLTKKTPKKQWLQSKHTQGGI